MSFCARPCVAHECIAFDSKEYLESGRVLGVAEWPTTLIQIVWCLTTLPSWSASWQQLQSAAPAGNICKHALLPLPQADIHASPLLYKAQAFFVAASTRAQKSLCAKLPSRQTFSGFPTQAICCTDSSRLSTVRLPCNFRSVSRQDVARSETLSPAWRLALIRYRHRPRRQWYAPTWSLLGACITWGTSAFHTPCPKFYAEASISGQAFARTVQHQAHCRHTALAGEMCSSYHPYARLQSLPDS